jgi:WD40 repeat protein
VQVWEPLRGKTLLTFRNTLDHRGPVAWSPDGTRIASSEGWPGVVQVWNPDTGEIISSYDGHSSYIFTLAWSPDGRFIASGGRDRTTQVWQP